MSNLKKLKQENDNIEANENNDSPFKIKQNKQSSPVKIDSSYHKTLKIYAANTERNIKSVVHEALKE